MAAAVRAPAHPHTLRGGREGRMHISTPPRPARKTPPPALPAAAFKGKRRLHPRLAPRGAPCSCARPAPPRSARAASWVTRWLRRCRGGGVELERESGRRALSRRIGQTHATLAASEITTAARRTAPPPPAEACARPRPGLEGASAGGAGRERQGMPSWLRSSDTQAQAHEPADENTAALPVGGLEGRHAHAPSRGGPSPGAHPPSLTSLHSQRPQTESLKRAPGAQALQPCRCRRPCLACGSFKVEPSSYGGGARLLPLAARPRGRRARRAGGSPVRRGSDRATQERRVALQKP